MLVIDHGKQPSSGFSAGLQRLRLCLANPSPLTSIGCGPIGNLLPSVLALAAQGLPLTPDDEHSISTHA